MQFLAALLLIVCYGLAAYLGFMQRTPIYLFAIVAGHIGALASPLWSALYGIRYSLDLSTVRTLLDQAIPATVLIGAGWFYALPALVVFYLFSTRWWFPGALTGLLTYAVFLLYHLFVETLGLRTQLWVYSGSELPLNFSAPLLAALMSGLVSYGLLYVLLAVHRGTWVSMALAILPATLLLSLLVHGLLGAPLWIALLLDGAAWAVLAGFLSALVLLAWAVQIVTGGISRLAN
jgi:hypothetical protein